MSFKVLWCLFTRSESESFFKSWLKFTQSWSVPAFWTVEKTFSPWKWLHVHEINYRHSYFQYKYLMTLLSHFLFPLPMSQHYWQYFLDRAQNELEMYFFGFLPVLWLLCLKTGKLETQFSHDLSCQLFVVFSTFVAVI